MVDVFIWFLIIKQSGQVSDFLFLPDKKKNLKNIYFFLILAETHKEVCPDLKPNQFLIYTINFYHSPLELYVEITTLLLNINISLFFFFQKTGTVLNTSAFVFYYPLWVEEDCMIKPGLKSTIYKLNKYQVQLGRIYQMNVTFLRLKHRLDFQVSECCSMKEICCPWEKK